MFIKKKVKYCLLAVLGFNSVLSSAAIVELQGNATVTASANYQSNVANNVIDSDITTYWSAGSLPTQWIEIDLGSREDITEIRALVEQTPEGETSHNIYIDDQYQDTLSGITTDGQILSYFLPTITSGQVIRIETTKSPSWVAWSEIVVMGEGIIPPGEEPIAPPVITPVPTTPVTPVPVIPTLIILGEYDVKLADNFDIFVPVIEYKVGNQQLFYTANFTYEGTDIDGKSLWALADYAPISTVPLNAVPVHLTDTPRPFVMIMDSIIAGGEDYRVVFEFVGSNSEFIWKAVDISLN